MGGICIFCLGTMGVSAPKKQCQDSLGVLWHENDDECDPEATQIS